MSLSSLRRRFLAGIVIATSALLFAGCSSDGKSYSDLDVNADSTEVLSDAAQSDSKIDADSARFIAENRGAKVWLAWGSADDSVCVILEPVDGVVSVSCDTAGNELTVRDGPTSYYVVADGAHAPDAGDNVRLSENVYVVSK